MNHKLLLFGFFNWKWATYISSNNIKINKIFWLSNVDLSHRKTEILRLNLWCWISNIFKKNIKILNMKLQLQETRINVNKYTRLVQKMIAMFSVNVGNQYRCFVSAEVRHRCLIQVKSTVKSYSTGRAWLHTHTMWLSGLFLPRCSVSLIIAKCTGHFIVKGVFIPTWNFLYSR